MNKQPALTLYVIAGACSVLMYTVLVGLGVHRYADPLIVCLGSTVLLFGPPLLAAFGAKGRSTPCCTPATFGRSRCFC